MLFVNRLFSWTFTIEIVISGGTDAVLDKVYNTRLDKIKVVGVLADNTYIPPGNFPNLETEDKLSIFDFYKPFDCNINTVAPFALVDQNLFTGEPADYNSTWFISYEDGLSDEDIAAAVIIMAGVIGSIAIATVRQIKNFGIFFLCGSSWKDCTRIITAYLTIFSFAIVLTLFSMAVMKIINMDYLIGSVYEMNNLAISIAEIAVMYLLAIILPHNIIKTTSPVETINEN